VSDAHRERRTSALLAETDISTPKDRVFARA
jgi:hypothetical protein